MTVAMNGVVALFSEVEHEQELHQILGFSYSHDQESVRIWGHYAVINADKTAFRYYSIRKYEFTEHEDLESWTAYNFMNMFMTHGSRLISSGYVQQLTIYLLSSNSISRLLGTHEALSRQSGQVIL